MRLRFAIATSSLNLPLRAAIKAAGSLPGVTGVRIDARQELKPGEMSQTGKRELLLYLNEHGLQLSSLGFSVRRAFYDQADLDRRVAATREALNLASLLKVPRLSLRVGRIPAAEETDAFSLLAETLNDLTRHGNHVGVTLALIPGAESVDQIAQFLDQIRTGPIAVDFDPARALAEGVNLSGRLRALHAYVAEFTARDAVRDFTGGVEETPLGRGEVIWDELLATLMEIDYRSWITLQRTTGENRLQDLERAATYLQRILGEF